MHARACALIPIADRYRMTLSDDDHLVIVLAERNDVTSGLCSTTTRAAAVSHQLRSLTALAARFESCHFLFTRTRATNQHPLTADRCSSSVLIRKCATQRVRPATVDGRPPLINRPAHQHKIAVGCWPCSPSISCHRRTSRRSHTAKLSTAEF